MKTKVDLKKKLNILSIITLLIFLALISRLGYLQFAEKERYQLMSEKNSHRSISLPAPRGKMLDVNGVALVDNRIVYTVYLAATDFNIKDREIVISKLADILEIEKEEIEEAIHSKRFRSYEPIIIKEDVPVEKVHQIEVRRNELPGVMIDLTPLRNYPFNNLASHTVGYTRQISEDQLRQMQERYPEKNYRQGDRYGRMGLENFFDPVLKGTDGYRLVEVDADHNPIKDVSRQDPTPGNNLHLTIDMELQKAAEEALENMLASMPAKWAVENRKTGRPIPDVQAGAVVLIEVETGRVLAMASKPDYDPSWFNERLPVGDPRIDHLWQKPAQAEFNRAISFFYPPGSTFKMATIGAALRTGKVRANERIHDPGVIYMGSQPFRNSGSKAHGATDVVKALQVSSNIYSALVAERAGSGEVAKFARELGMGEKTGITLPGEKSGLIPSPEWKLETATKRYDSRLANVKKKIEEKYEPLLAAAKTAEEREALQKQKNREITQAEREANNRFRWDKDWRRSDTFYNAIGQSATTATPLQLAVYTAALANGGTVYKPYLIDKVTDYRGRVVEEYGPQVINEVDISSEDLIALQKGMLAVNQPGGTASFFTSLGVKSAGKTGTSQVTGKMSHGLYVGYAPYDNPKIAAAAIIEHGVGGGASAGVVVRDLFQAYFDLQSPEKEEEMPDAGE